MIAGYGTRPLKEFVAKLSCLPYNGGDLNAQITSMFLQFMPPQDGHYFYCLRQIKPATMINRRAYLSCEYKDGTRLHSMP